MSGIGFSELIILCLIGLIVLGPERLPRVANQIGSWLGQARRMTRVMKRQLEEELDFEGKNDIRPPAGEPTSSPFPQTPAAASAESAVDDTLSAEPEAPDEAEYRAANEHDDTWSPAHAADSVGTGVSDQPDEQPEAEATEATTADVTDEKERAS